MAMLEALAVFYWWKNDFERFLRSQLKDCPEILARLSFGETKRQVAAEVVGLLSRYEDQYQGAALDLLVELARFDEQFRHLRRCEDPEPKIADARAALEEVRRVVDSYSARPPSASSSAARSKTMRPLPRSEGHTTAYSPSSWPSSWRCTQ